MCQITLPYVLIFIICLPQCLDKQRYPQALIEWQAEGNGTSQVPTCGSFLTDFNWETGLKIKIIANVDGLKDKDQLITLQVSAQLKEEVLGNATVSVGKIDVS